MHMHTGRYFQLYCKGKTCIALAFSVYMSITLGECHEKLTWYKEWNVCIENVKQIQHLDWEEQPKQTHKYFNNVYEHLHPWQTNTPSHLEQTVTTWMYAALN